MFARHVDFIASTYTVVRLRDIVNYVLGLASLPGNAIAITFDDGYLDNLTVALPILSEFGLPATIFVATGFVGARIPLYSEMLPALSWDQIHEMSRVEGIEFGSHTRTHIRLCDVPEAVARKTVLDSKSDLEKHLGLGVRMLSYPQGRFDLNTIRIVREAGFEAACGGTGVVHRWISPYRLRRFQVERATSPGDLAKVLAARGRWFAQASGDAIRRMFDARRV